jgi:CDGSH-type Zn-finger protein
VNTLRLRENGPYAVHAALRVAGHDDGFRATLCRCGQSRRKPYCDGSHTAAGFAATGEPATRPSDPLGERGGVLSIAQ